MYTMDKGLDHMDLLCERELADAGGERGTDILHHLRVRTEVLSFHVVPNLVVASSVELICMKRPPHLYRSCLRRSPSRTPLPGSSSSG